jgi:hypothetical protein
MEGIRLAAARTMMRRAATALVLVVMGMQPLTSKRQQEMSEEVAALHRAGFEVQDDQTLGDPALWRDLAIRYLDGRGVEQDVIQVILALQPGSWVEFDAVLNEEATGQPTGLHPAARRKVPLR